LLEKTETSRSYEAIQDFVQQAIESYGEIVGLTSPDVHPRGGIWINFALKSPLNQERLIAILEEANLLSVI
jgi:hypothetical protein